MHAIDNKDPVQAADILSKLKTDFEKKFGKTVTFGGSSKGFEMIEELEQKIQTMIDDQVELKPSSISPS